MTQVQDGRLLEPVFTIHDRLMKARREAGLSKDELAERIGVHRRTIANYEDGETQRLKPYVLKAWAEATGVSLEWLLDRDTDRYLDSAPDQRLCPAA